MKKLKSFESTRTSIRIYWDQKLAAVGRLLVFDDGENESLEDDVHSFVDKTTHLTTALLRQGVEMIIP